MRAGSHQPQGAFGIRRQPADGVTSRVLFHVHSANVTMTTMTRTPKEENDGIPILRRVRRLQRS